MTLDKVKPILHCTVALGLFMLPAPQAHALPAQGQYVDDPRCDPIPDIFLTHELGTSSVFPIDERIFADAKLTNTVVCVPDDGIANDWEVRMLNLSPIPYVDVFFVVVEVGGDADPPSPRRYEYVMRL